MTPSSILPILSLIDISHDIDLSLALRRIGRERRQERSRKGWETRRAHGGRAWSKMADRHKAATDYLAARKRIKRLRPWDLVEKFGLSYIAARKLLYRAQLDRGEISLADLTPDMRRQLVDPKNLDLKAIAAGPIMDSNQIYLPAGKLSMAETKAREAANIVGEAA